MTTAFVTPGTPMTSGFYYPATPTQERRREPAIPFAKRAEKWLSQRLKNELSQHDVISGANKRLYDNLMASAWRMAEPVLAERFYTLSLNPEEFGSTSLHATATQCFGMANTTTHKLFREILSAKMAKHFFKRRYLSPVSELDNPRVTEIHGSDSLGLYLDHRKIKPDLLILAGTLIAEAENLLLVFADESRYEMVERFPAYAVELICSGIPDTLPQKHWDRRSLVDCHIDDQKAAERSERASAMDALHIERIAQAKKLTFSDAEMALKTYFDPAKKEPAA